MGFYNMKEEKIKKLAENVRKQSEKYNFPTAPKKKNNKKK